MLSKAPHRCKRPNSGSYTPRKSHQPRPSRQSPAPEWQAKRWVVVDPAIWPYYKRRGRDLRPFHREVLQAFADLHVDVVTLGKADCPLDIWIKDWACVVGYYFNFPPHYGRFLYPRAEVNRARVGLDRHLLRSPGAVSLVLDGGNVVHDGAVAVVTDRVLADNPTFSKAQITALIATCGFQQVILIPVEPGDRLGHADGVLKFLRNDFLLLNDYRRTPLEGYGRRVERILKRRLPHKQIIRFPFSFTDEIFDKFYSAVGLYLNLIVTKHGIILPTFSSSLDVRARTTLERITNLPVRSVLTSPLAHLGGGLSCIALPL